MPSVLLIHGGLWEDTGADWFWRRTGVIDGLAGRGLTVMPPNPLHPRSAVDALLRLLPSAVELPGCPEPPRPDFTSHLGSLVAALAGFARA